MAAASGYDAFISYSHQHDGTLAPALKTALERFAIPWYRPRTLRIFRDEANLAASPHLWESVEAALKASEWFVLLASQQAARSEWVNREVAWWLANRPADRLLIVATDPGMAWDAARGDWAVGAPVPPALRGALRGEPRLVDLADVQAANGHRPEFPAEKTADLVAAIRGKQKDQLFGEHLRQRRRSRRLIRGAITVLTALTAVSVASTVIAIGQRDNARTQATLAESRALAAEATADLSSNPEESLRLALNATQINAGGPAEQALRLAMAQDPLRMVIRSGTGSGTLAAWDGSRAQVAVTAPHNSIALWDTATGRLSQILHLTHASAANQLLYDADGSRLAAVSSAGYVSIWNIAANGIASPVSTTGLNSVIHAAANPADLSVGILLNGTWSGNGGDVFVVYSVGLSNVFAFNVQSGAIVPIFGKLRTGPWDVAPSPDGKQLLVDGSLVNLATGYDTSLSLPQGTNNGSFGPACWFPDGSAVVTWSVVQVGGPEWINRTANGSLLAQMQTPSAPTTAVACSAGPADEWVAAGDEAGNVLLRLAGGRLVSLYGHNAAITGIASSPDGRYLATASADGTVRLWDASTGEATTVLNGDGADLTAVQFGSTDGLLLTVDSRGFVRIWDTGLGEPVTQLQSPDQGEAVTLGFSDDGRQVAGADLVSTSGSETEVTAVSALTWNARTGQLLHTVPLPDFAASSVPCTRNLEEAVALAQLTPSGNACGLAPPPNLALALPVTTSSFEGATAVLAMAASPDGSYVAYARSRSLSLLASDGREVAALPVESTPTGLSFVAGSDRVIVMTDSAIYLWRPFSGHPPLVISQPSPPVDVAWSASGDRLVTANGGESVIVWNAVNGRLIRTFRPPPTPRGSPRSEPAPLRVAMSATGDVVASGNSDGTVCVWNVDNGNRIRDVAASSFPIAELSSAANESSFLAVDSPSVASGDLPPATGDVLNAETGNVLATYQSPDVSYPPVIPGAALSPDGNFLLAGPLGLAPAPPGGVEAVYQVSTGQTMAELRDATEPVTTEFPEFPAQPWSPDGTEVLVHNAIYSCDACGALSQLQAAAAARIAWSQPLSATSDHPPASNPYS